MMGWRESSLGALAEDPGSGPSTHGGSCLSGIIHFLRTQCRLLASLGTRHAHGAQPYFQADK